MLRIYGTETSPYVRRIRVIAHELGLEHELIPTVDEAGQAELRAHNPLWKVPTAQLADQLLFDSSVIGEALVARAGADEVRPIASLDERNAITVIDGALDSLINVFYLGRDGVSPEQSSYLAKQNERAAAAMHWLELRVKQGWLAASEGTSLGEIALATTAAWMRFRGTYPIERHPALLAVLTRCEPRASFVATQPPGA